MDWLLLPSYSTTHLFDALFFEVLIRLRPLGQLITFHAVVEQVQLLVTQTTRHFGKLGHQVTWKIGQINVRALTERGLHKQVQQTWTSGSLENRD